MNNNNKSIILSIIDPILTKLLMEGLKLGFCDQQQQPPQSQPQQQQLFWVVTELNLI